jgi:hypothetical protein
MTTYAAVHLACDQAKVRRAARLVGDQLEAERLARIAARDAAKPPAAAARPPAARPAKREPVTARSPRPVEDTTRCTFLGCPAPPVSKVKPHYGRPWFGCKAHAPAMADALSIGQSPERGAKVVPLPTA